jgi:flagellar biosynthetic protein FliR
VAVSVDLQLVMLVAIVALRLAILLALVPLMDNRSVPLLWRLAVAVPLAWALAPAALVHSGPLPTELGWPRIALEAVNSLVIGALLAFAMNLVLTGVRFGGSLAGMQIGFAIVNAYDPQTGSQISIIAQLYYLLTVLLFFALDVHHHLVAVLVASIEIVPPLSTPDLAHASGVVLRAYSDVFMLGLRVAAPVALVLLLVSAAMGVIVKTAPQIHVLVVGFPVKIAAGIFVLGATLVYFGGVVERQFAGSEDLLQRVLGVL